MSKGDLQDYVHQQLDGDDNFGVIDDVSCERALDAVVGDSATCTVTGSEGAIDVRTSVDRIEDGQPVVVIKCSFMKSETRSGR